MSGNAAWSFSQFLQPIDSLKFIVQAFGSREAVILFEPLSEVVRWTYVFSRSTDLVNI